ncbi:MAG: transmembrane 220 family protein [Kofleriaceae bacterium]
MKPVPAWFRWLSYVMAALFVLCAVLQYNDPDPVRWMAIYGAGAVVSALMPARKPVAGLGMLVGLACAIWSIWLIHATWGLIALSDLTSKMSEKGGAVEAGREAGGLAIEAVWLLAASAFRGRRA